MTPITTIVTPEMYLSSKFASLVTGILFANHANKAQFSTPVFKGDAPTSLEAQRAEVLYNTVGTDAYRNDIFAITIKAMTGETIRQYSPVAFTPKVGMVLTPVAPLFRDRTDDGYEIGQVYLVTNETTGRARNVNNADVKYLNSKHGYGVKPMSRMADEWQMVEDQTVIEQLVKDLTAALGMGFVDSMLVDSGDGKSLAWVLNKLAE